MKATTYQSLTCCPTLSPPSVYVLLQIEGEDAGEAAKNPLNLCLVIDRSSSMRGARITYAIMAAQRIIDRLTDRDLLTVVAFDRDVRIVFGPEFVSDKTRLSQRLGDMMTGYLTNLGDGYLSACKLLRRNIGQDKHNRALLLTDGLPSYGVRDAEELATMARWQREFHITTSTIGLGDGFDEDLLIAMAEDGAGNFYYVREPADIPDIVLGEVEQATRLEVQDLVLSVYPGRDVLLKKVHHRYRWEDEAQHKIHVGSLAEGTFKEVLLEFGLPEECPVGDSRLCSMTLAGTGVDPLVFEQNIRFSLEESPQDTESAVVSTVLQLEAEELTAAAVAAIDQNDRSNARELLGQAAVKIKAALRVRAERTDLQEFLREIEDIRRKLEEMALLSESRKRMRYLERGSITLVGKPDKSSEDDE